MRITILHPDLGIGGAERLIVDAAVALRDKGHHVRIVTNHFDPSHAFKETKDLDIATVVDWLPKCVFGKMFALMAYLKMLIAALYVVMFYDSDVILSDSISASQFVLKYFSSAKLVFYCHFPDMLLTKRETTAKKMYRYIIDAVEAYTTGLADVICVNSNFTKGVVQNAIRGMDKRDLKVLYPSLNTAIFDSIEGDELGDLIPSTVDVVFTSLNRFERKKNVRLAIDAFAKMRQLIGEEEFAKCHLVIAGGYDRKNGENIEYYEELVEHSETCGLDATNVSFLRSPTDEQKVRLIRKSRAVLYTPDREHFGIVPVEAMYLGTPVIAVNSGGPCESVKDGETGFLVEQTDEAFAEKMAVLLRNFEKWREMSEMGTRWVNQMFSFEAFSSKLDDIVESLY